MKKNRHINQRYSCRYLAAQTSCDFIATTPPDTHCDSSANPLFISQMQFGAGMRILILGCMLVLLALPYSKAAEPRADQPPLVLGVHPYKSASKLVAIYKPLAAYLSRKTGHTITLRIARDYRSHIQLTGEDKLDIAYMGPASFVELVARFGKKPLLARQAIYGSPTFQGKIVVRQNSTTRSLDQLVGKRFAFGDPASTMSHLVPRYMLRMAGVTVNTLAAHSFLGSHDNVALAVLSGDFDAGAVKEAVYNKYQSRGLKALDTTPALSEHLFVTRSTLPVNLQQSLREALYALKDDPEGPSIMFGIKSGMTAYLPVKDADYDNLRIIINSLTEAGITQ